jgi:hypothetical protein
MKIIKLSTHELVREDESLQDETIKIVVRDCFESPDWFTILDGEEHLINLPKDMIPGLIEILNKIKD